MKNNKSLFKLGKLLIRKSHTFFSEFFEIYCLLISRMVIEIKQHMLQICFK